MDIGTRVRSGQRLGRVTYRGGALTADVRWDDGVHTVELVERLSVRSVEDLADRLEACIERYIAGEIDSDALSAETELLWEEASEDAATHAALSDIVTTRALADFPLTRAGRLVGVNPDGREILSTCWAHDRWETIGPDDGSEDVVHDTGEAAEAHHHTRCAALGLDVVRVDRAGETEALCARIAEAHVALADGDRETARAILADVLTVLALWGGE